MVYLSAVLWPALFVMAVACGIAQYMLRQGQNQSAYSAEFKSFQLNYLIVYFLVMCADWLQGPYVYVLYESYGFKKSDIAVLFVLGFGSSMLFGTFMGSLADNYGRKKLCLVFGVLYSLACLTKLSHSFNILLLGRFLSGISTSLLFSVFESWMVYEHHKRGYSADWLSQTFGVSIFGNGIVAIVAGFMASGVASAYGYVAPFMLAIVFLLIATLIVWATWTENYGDSRINVQENLTKAVNAMKGDMRILLLGGVQSLFEAAMYVFVFLWTPALAEDAEEFSQENSGIHGLVFSAFMVAIMLGSSAFSFLIRTKTPEFINTRMLLVASVSIGIPAFISMSVPNATVSFLSFLVFEACCGIYFPTQGTLRSAIIPEESRSTIMNFFRVGLNFLVVTVLLLSERMSHSTTFFICVSWLGLAAYLMHTLASQPHPTIKPAEPVAQPSVPTTDELYT